MTQAMTLALAVYALGVFVGLLRTDAPLPARAGLALAWPIGPLALAVTVAMLVVVAVIALPGRKKSR